MDNMIACCGFDCRNCDAYKATIDNNEELRKKVAKLWSNLNNFEILPSYINCLGCRNTGIKTIYCSEMCEIRKCVLGKGYDTCAQCSEMDTCSIVAPMFENNPAAHEKLTELAQNR